MKNMGLPLKSELDRAGVDSEAFKSLELDWYDGSIRAADVELSRVVEKLDELGLGNDTLVVFLSDHGEEFFDHGGSFHEENVYGELVNVPLVMRWPAVLPRGLVVAETVELLDVAPTLADLAGLRVPDEMQGQSLRPLLFSDASSRSGRWKKRPAISEWRKRTDQKGTRIVDCFGIIEDGWKLVRNVDRPADVPELELYDHRNDPLDQKDVSSEHPDIVSRLAERLEGWHKWALEHKLPTNEQATGDMGAEELERLRSLGYVQ
jgi:arylsulfatase A-like enzyme